MGESNVQPVVRMSAIEVLLPKLMFPARNVQSLSVEISMANSMT